MFEDMGKEEAEDPGVFLGTNPQVFFELDQDSTRAGLGMLLLMLLLLLLLLQRTGRGGGKIRVTRIHQGRLFINSEEMS